MNLIEKETQIIIFLNKYEYSYVKLNEDEINIVYDLYFNNKENEITSANSFLYYGVYYKFKKDGKKLFNSN